MTSSREPQDPSESILSVILRRFFKWLHFIDKIGFHDRYSALTGKFSTELLNEAENFQRTSCIMCFSFHRPHVAYIQIGNQEIRDKSLLLMWEIYCQLYLYISRYINICFVILHYRPIKTIEIFQTNEYWQYERCYRSNSSRFGPLTRDYVRFI